MHCCPPPERWVARAQPWLGTLVEIALPPDQADDERFAAAFAAIAHVHRRMSAHDPSSDLARIARDAHRRPVIVDRQTLAVLELARDLARVTRGRFDVTTPAARRRNAHHRGMSSLRLERGRRVRTDAPLALDLSGIAKGYAVDRAVDALRSAGAVAGRVNAGGDLRVFGPGIWMPVRVRLPRRTTLALPLFELQDAAAATSADYFRDGGGALYDPRARRLRPFGGSITVVAPSCALADALTKVVALMPRRAVALLAHYGAHAFRLDPEGLACATTCHASTPRLRLPAAGAEEMTAPSSLRLLPGRGAQPVWERPGAG
jgi:thiamine biosynthesis lipoprotein